jgi:SAM-dependent methyltransferase
LRRTGAANVTGIDSRDELVEWASAHVERRGLTFRTVQSGQPLPFEDEAFDVVVALDPRGGLGEERFREIRRILVDEGVLIVAQSAQPPLTFAHVLPYLDREPVGEASDPIDPELLGELFGEPIMILERPLLGLDYGTDEGNLADDQSRSRPETMLSGTDDDEIVQRLWAYGLDEDPKPSFVSLPYSYVVRQFDLMMREYEHDAERLESRGLTLDSLLSDSERQVADLGRQVFILQQDATAPKQELQRRDSVWFGGGSSGHTSHQDPRIRELWESAAAWQQYAEELQTQLQSVTAGDSDRENALQRKVEQLRTELYNAKQAAADADRAFAATREALSRSREELQERRKYAESLQDRVDGGQRQLDEFIAEAKEAFDERNQLRRELELAQEKVVKVETNTLAPKAPLAFDVEIRKLNRTITTLEREKVTHKVEILALEKEHAELAQAKSALDRKLTALESGSALRTTSKSEKAAPSPQLRKKTAAPQARKKAAAPKPRKAVTPKPRKAAPPKPKKTTAAKPKKKASASQPKKKVVAPKPQKAASPKPKKTTAAKPEKKAATPKKKDE